MTWEPSQRNKHSEEMVKTERFYTQSEKEWKVVENMIGQKVQEPRVGNWGKLSKA